MYEIKKLNLYGRKIDKDDLQIISNYENLTDLNMSSRLG